MNVHHLYAPIATLNLSTVRSRLMHPRAGLGWSEARALAAERDYREFLRFAKDHPAAKPSPTAEVDAFWHFHILDTLKYARDCADVFGYFLHHEPAVEFAAEDRAPAVAAMAAPPIAYCALSRPPLADRPISLSDASYCALARPAAAAAYCAVAARA